MTNLADLELPYLDVFTDEFLQDPHSHYAEALKESWIAKFENGYMLLDYQSMKDFLSDEDKASAAFEYFIDQWGCEDTSWAKMQLDHPASRSGPEHMRLRTLIMPAFSRKKADQFRPLMRERFEALIDEVVDQGECDFARVACQYPITVISIMLGVPLDNIPRLEPWLLALVEGQGQAIEKLGMLNEAVEGLLDFIGPVIAERRAGTRKDDLLQEMIDAADEKDKLTDAELHHFVIGLLSGGYDTTMNQIIHTTQRMCENPEAYKKLAADPEGQKHAFIEESLRLKCMFGTTMRTTNKDLEYRGIKIPANTLLTIPLTFSGQDPAQTKCPAHFDLDRGPAPHLAWGLGIHMCPGKYVALALMEEAIPIIATRLKNPRLVGEREYVGPLGPWALRKMPLEWDVD